MTALVLLLACGQGVIALGDEPGANPGTDPGTGDTGEPIDEPEPHVAAGDYEAEIYWEMPDWDWVICDGSDFDFAVDDEGAFGDGGVCTYYSQGGYEYDLEYEIAGQLDEDGNVEGEITFYTWEYSSDWELNGLTSDLDGSIEDGEVDFSFYTYAYMGDYGDLEVYGQIWGDAE